MVDGLPPGGGVRDTISDGGVWGAHGTRGRPSATVSQTRGISLRKRERAHTAQMHPYNPRSLVSKFETRVNETRRVSSS